MSAEEILFEAEMTMEKSVDYMVHEFSAVRTGKASPNLVENVDVEAYGSAMKLKQLALITTPEPRLLVVQPFDAGTVRDIEKALKESKMGKLSGCRFPSCPRNAGRTWSNRCARWRRKRGSASARIGEQPWTKRRN